MAVPKVSLTIAGLAMIASAFILADSPLAAGKAAPKKAAAPIDPPMRVYIVRSAAPGCEPDCPEWIAAQGRIEAGSLGRFKKVLKQLGKRNLPVLIHSGGGMSYEAMAIGRLLRSKKLDVGVSKTLFTPCAPDETACLKKDAQKTLRGMVDAGYAVCASSCGFILAAGTRRFVGAGSVVGVHRGEVIQTKVLRNYRMTPYRATDGSIRYKRTLLSQKVVGERRRATPDGVFDMYEDYFEEMGIGDDIMNLLVATPNSNIHWLKWEELRSTKIATHRMSGEQLIVGDTAPEDGWTASSYLPFLPSPAKPSQDCALHGTGCAWQFKALMAVAPVKTKAEPPPSAMQDCARSASGCSEPSKPEAPSTNSTSGAHFAPIVPLPGSSSHDCVQSGEKCPWQDLPADPVGKPGTPSR
jgi:hypothetical protein